MIDDICREYVCVVYLEVCVECGWWCPCIIDINFVVVVAESEVSLSLTSLLSEAGAVPNRIFLWCCRTSNRRCLWSCSCHQNDTLSFDFCSKIPLPIHLTASITPDNYHGSMHEPGHVVILIVLRSSFFVVANINDDDGQTDRHNDARAKHTCNRPCVPCQ